MQAAASLLLLLAATALRGAGAQGPLVIASEADLLAAAAASASAVTVAVLSAHVVLSGARVVVPPGASLTLRADAAACGPAPADWPAAEGLCVLDAGGASAHFLVSDTAALALHGVALVNGNSGGENGGSLCVGLCSADGNANYDDYLAAAAVGSTLLLNNSLFLANVAGQAGTPAGAGCVNLDSNSTLTAYNTTFSGCVAYGTGGAVSAQDATVVLTDCVLEDNGVWGYTLGGGLYVVPYYTTVVATLTRVRFSRNLATTGGAWMADFGAPRPVHSCDSCSFDNNLAGVFGGAVYAIGSSLTFTDSTFLNNTVSPSFNDDHGQKTAGGAVAALPYPARGEDTLGLGLMPCGLVLRNCSLEGNAVASATGEGGALYIADANALDADTFTATAGSLAMDGCALQGNSGALGGAVYAGTGARVDVSGSVFDANVVTGAGGAVGASGAAALAVADSNFSDNAAGVAGGGLWHNARGLPGCAAALARCAFSGNSAAGDAPHGGALSLEHLAAATLDGVAFANNALTVVSADAAAALDVTLRTAATSTLGAGAGGALFAVSALAPAMQLNATACAFSSNAAEQGGAAALLSGVVAIFDAGCTYDNNTASAAGGALFLGGAAGASTTLRGGSALRRNAAPLGGAVLVSGGHALAVADTAASDNAAQYGAVVYLDQTVAAPAAQLAVSNLTAARNAAAIAGGITFLRAPPAATGAPLPRCAACAPDAALAAANGAGSYGGGFASAPIRFALTAPPSARSGELLSTPLSAVAYDAYGTAVADWPALSASVAATAAATGAAAGRALAGAAPALYAAGGVAFPQLSLSGAEGASFVLTMTLTSATAPALAAGLAANVTLTIARCDVTELFDAASQRCACIASAVRAAEGDTFCTCGGGFFWAAATAECAPCPEGATCVGGAALTADGFWRARANDSASYECSPGRCAAVEPPATAAVVVPAVNCTDGHTGPLCSVCCAPGLPGCGGGGITYAQQGELCLPCADADAWAHWPPWKRGLLLAGCIIIGAAVTFLTFFVPLLPRVSAALMRLLSHARTAVARVAHALCGTPLPDKAAELEHAAAVLHRRTAQLKFASQHIALEPHAADGYLAPPHDITMTTAAAVSADVNAPPAHEPEPELDPEVVKHERHKRTFALLQEQVLEALKPLKIVINFLQIVMTLPTTLHIHWPGIFYRIAARLSVVNVQLLSLPRLACMHPEPSYYSVFLGYNLGTAAAVGGVLLIYAIGAALHVGLRRGARDDKRFQSFTNRCVTAFLIVLYLAYPSVSQAALLMLSCQPLPSPADAPGAAPRWYLRTDARIECGTPVHRAYSAAAVFFIILYPVGVPLFFWAALRYYGVPALAAAKQDAAWLCAAADLATRQAGVAAPPDVDPRALSADTIPEDYLTTLHALFCAGEEGEEEGESGRGCCRRTAAKEEAAPLTREAKLRALLRWCRREEALALPPLQWRTASRLEEEAETPFARAAPPLHPSPAEALAESRVGFLYDAYHVQCWYWEIVELLRKLLLTGVMALVRPGSASQVLMGLLISFGAVVAYSRLNPYAERGVNRLGFLAQLNLFLFLLVALLLRVHADAADPDGSVYNGIVGTLSLSLLVVPPINQLIQAFSDDVEASVDN